MALTESLRYKRYDPTTATTTFLVTFPIWDDDEVVVLVDGAEVTAFSVTASFASGTGRADNASVVLATAVSGVSVEIYGDRAARAEGGYSGNASRLTEVLGNDFDRLAAVQQEIRRDLGRAPLLPMSEAGGDGVSFPLPDDGRTLAWDADGNIINGPAVDEISAAQGYAVSAGQDAAAASNSATSAAISAAVSSSVTGRVMFPTVATMFAALALTYVGGGGVLPVSAGEIVEGGGHRYLVADAAATDHDVTGDGGVKFYIVPRNDVVSLEQYNLTPDGVTDIRPSLQAAVNKFRQIYIPATPASGLTAAEVWYCDGTINVNRTVRIFGAAGTQAGFSPSIIRWEEGTPGVIFHTFDTEGDASGNVIKNSNTGSSPFARGSVIESLTLISDDANDPVTYDGTSHAIWAKVRVRISDCYISGWPGNGIHIVATASSSDPLVRGNANNWTTRDNRIQNCGTGFYLDGADANAGVSMHDDSSSNAFWGLWDSSFLGNTFLGFHTNGNGDPAKRQWNQKQYVCINSALSGATAPDTDPTVWWEFGTAGTGSAATWTSGVTYAVGASVLASNGRVYRPTISSGASTTEPLFDGSADQALADGYTWEPTLNEVWKSGETVPEGGAKLTDGDSNNTVFIGCYDEGGQPSRFKPNALSLYPGSGFEQEANGGSQLLSQNGWTLIKAQRNNDQNDIVKYEVFGKTGSAKLGPVHLGSLDIDTYTQTQRVNLIDTTRGAVVLRDANSDSAMTRLETLFGTTATFGRASSVPHAVYVPRMFIGPSWTNGRQITMATAQPTSGEFARGDVIFNLNAAAAGVAGWVCTTTGVAGSTAVFKAMANLAA